MILKLNKKNMFKPVLSVLSIILIVIVFFLVDARGVSFSEYFPTFLLIISIPVIPCTYLFIEYFIVTRNQTVEITSEFISIKYKEGKISYYPSTELEVIKLYKSKGAEKGNFVFATHQMFYHAEIFTKSGKRLILTSFLGPNFDEALDSLKNIRKDVKRSIFSTIYFKLF
jgi:hypothetical protein